MNRVRQFIVTGYCTWLPVLLVAGCSGIVNDTVGSADGSGVHDGRADSADGLPADLDGTDGTDGRGGEGNEGDAAMGDASPPRFTVYDGWDFEDRSVGPYTDDLIREDFDVVTSYDHGSGSIELHERNGEMTKVLKVTHEAHKTSVGFDLDAQLSRDFDEVYLSYNIKFSEEFNSTKGGKLPGLGGLPVVTANNCPSATQGFLCKSMHKYAGSLITYHYDRTPPNYPDWCPWSESVYRFQPIYFSNGTWYNITRRVVMNSFTDGAPNADGVHELWVDGRMIFQEDYLILWDTEAPDKKINDLNIAQFYGGSDLESEPIHESYSYLDNFKVFVPNNDPTLGTRQLHDPAQVLSTPDEIFDRDVYVDRVVDAPGAFANDEYGATYSSCIDEATLIDAGAGHIVSYSFDVGLGNGAYLFFYDGRRSDSTLIRVIEGYASVSGQVVNSSGRYLFVRFSTDTRSGHTGFNGTLSFN